MPQPHIRPYITADKPAVMALLALNTPQYFAPSEAHDLSHYLDHEREDYFVLMQGDDLVGAGGINYVEEGTHAKLSWDFLHPGAQGKGWGRMLALHRLELLRRHPTVRRVSVRTSQHACGFYARLGFVEQERVPDYWAAGHDLVRMEWLPTHLQNPAH